MAINFSIHLVYAFFITEPLIISAFPHQIDELRAAVVAARAKERDADARARVADHKNLEAAAREENLQKNLAKNLDELAAYKAEAEREMGRWREKCDRWQGEAENAREEIELQAAEVCVVCALRGFLFLFSPACVSEDCSCRPHKWRYFFIASVAHFSSWSSFLSLLFRHFV